ncbi:hypothetical protein BTVI_04179 [Pitangus sulphuratus]|nr:hypothetical protein BTVI_04179 [Pitangus sulphuratus]
MSSLVRGKLLELQGLLYTPAVVAQGVDRCMYLTQGGPFFSIPEDQGPKLSKYKWDKRELIDFDLNGYAGIHYQYVKIQIVGYIMPLLNFFR